MEQHLRCAIYTRKSTEERLEQDFNSLDAQREACSAYIKSQRHEGWQALPELYDDGGFSGGSMERPALEQLLADIEMGRIDVVVVYKVDRLTRSLADFARIVQIFDGAGVSFVSVTQQFNTTTSMGRLTLNVLLSFAQFEREVTAERIRDKIAASKAKGLWMGGIPPIGYRPKNRQLVVAPDEADTVRHIFQRYLDLRSVRKLQAELASQGYLTPVRVSQKGRQIGGCSFSKGKLYALLSNPVYIGKIRHREKIYEGQHTAIVELEVWNRAQALLRTNRLRHTTKAHAAHPSPLVGRLYDPAGERMRPVHTTKNGKRYRYYVSPPLIDSSIDAGASGWRIPAEEVESTLARAISQHLGQPSVSADFLHCASTVRTSDVKLRNLTNVCDRLREPGSRGCKVLLGQIIRRVDLKETALRATVTLGRILGECSDEQDGYNASSVEIEAPIKLVRRGAELKLILRGAAGEATIPDANLVRSILDARRRLRAYTSGSGLMSISAIAAAEGTNPADVSRSLQLAFLAPDIVSAILDGRHPAYLTATRLQRLDKLPLLWNEQRALIG